MGRKFLNRPRKNLKKLIKCKCLFCVKLKSPRLFSFKSIRTRISIGLSSWKWKYGSPCPFANKIGNDVELFCDLCSRCSPSVYRFDYRIISLLFCAEISNLEHLAYSLTRFQSQSHPSAVLLWRFFYIRISCQTATAAKVVFIRARNRN